MKSAHEKLEEYIRDNHTNFFNISFTKSCGVFGGFLKPEASANNVWRWCKKGHVPNKRYHASIRERTGIDFSEAVRPPKFAPAKHTPSVSPVDFQDLQWARTEAPCIGCFIDGGSDECENAVRAITGQKCKSRGFVLKRKPAWEVCTKQNTKVGDVVRIIGGAFEYEVRYIMNGVGEAEMIVRSLDPLLIDRVQKMHHCEVEI